LEFCGLFLVLPFVVVYGLPGHPVIPVLWVVTAGCLAWLWRQPDVDRGEFFRWSVDRSVWRRIGLRFAVAAVLLTALLLLARPDYLLALPRRRPVLWMLVMVLYPLLSVYPQGIVYRAFYNRRYSALFTDKMSFLAAGAVAFAITHVVFRNPWAVGFTLVGGWFFLDTYLRTRSVLVAAVEHSLYGCFLFTIGFGSFFYNGSIRTAQQVIERMQP
jgi:hypothetical protein